MTTKQSNKDDDDVLKDGHVSRTPMMMRDEAAFNDALQLADAEIKQRNGLILRDGGSVGAHRPGWTQDKSRGFAVGATGDALQKLYDRVEARDAAAWQGDAEWFEPHKLGTSCTVRNSEFPTHQGEPGHVREVGDRLVCVPDNLSADEQRNQQKLEKDSFEPTGDAVVDAAMTAALAIEDVKERSYAIANLEAENAWRVRR